VPDPSTFGEAWAILVGYGLLDGVPATVRERLDAGRRGAVPETPKPGDPLFDQVTNVIVGDNRVAAAAAVARAANDSYPFWQALGDAVMTGPTGTNVNDLTCVIAV
jgi:glycerate-2-kinase